MKEAKKRFFLQKDFKLISIDSGFHAFKVLNCYGEYIYFPSYSKKVEKEYDDALISHYLMDGQKESDILAFFKDEKEGYILGQDALTLYSNNGVDVGFDERYNTNMFCTSERYKKELICAVARALYNNKEKKFEQKEYAVVLSIGLPSEQSDDMEIKKKIAGDLVHQSFTLEIAIDKKANDENYNKVLETISFTIEKLFIYAQPRGAISTVTMTDKGEIKPEKVNADILSLNTLIVDGGYGTLDIYHTKRGKLIKGDLRTLPELGAKTIDARILDKYKPRNSILKLQTIREKIDEKKFEIDADKTIKKYKFETDYNNITQKICESFKSVIVSGYNNFSEYDNVVFAGGMGKAYYNYIAESFESLHKLHLAKVEYIEDEDMATIFANVEGYYRFTLGKLLRLPENDNYRITSEDFKETDVVLVR